MLLLLTGFFEAFYYNFLAKAYRAGDISIVYTTARSLPVLFVTGYMLIVGRGYEINFLGKLGSLLVVVGLFILSAGQSKKFSIKNVASLPQLYALCAALGTTGYSIIDEQGLRMLKNMNSVFSNLDASCIYLILDGIITSFWMGIFILFSSKERNNFSTVIREYKFSSAVMGIGIYITYGLVLMAMTFAENVGYIVAFRQLSILIAALMGWVFLKEAMNVLKGAGIIISLLGLILVGLG